MLRLLKQRTLIQRIHNPIITHESAVSHFASSAASTRRKDAFAPCGALKRLTSSKGKTAGRNSSGRITSFHRGGGAKRLQRKIDLKRRTSSVGIVERIEYDPNRTSRIALVRWTEGVKQLRRQRESEDAGCDSAPPPQILDDTKVTCESVFSFSSLPGKVGLTKVGWLKGKKSNTDDTVVVGFPEFKGEKKKTSPVSFNSALDLPWIAVAGAKPAFFAPKLRENTNNKTGENSFSLSEIQKYKNPKPKRKGAISWHSDYNNQYPSGLLVASVQDKSNSTIITSQLIANALSKNRPSNPNTSKTFRKPLVQAQSTQINRAPVSYILASNKCSVGTTVMNVDFSKPSKTLNSSPKPISNFNFQDSTQAQTPISSYNYDMLDISSKPGNCIPLKDIRMGTFVHDIECHPGQGAKLARGAGSYGKIVKEPAAQCLIRLPSGVEKLIDARCRATIGIGSNVGNRMKKLRKAGHSRWLGRRPVVRGVAMNPVDHPHGGGEGRTKGGRPSVSPWGKPTKAGFKSPGVKKTKMMAK